MKQKKEIITESSEQTQKLGEELASRLHLCQGVTLVALYGELGSGKTTFVKGLANGLGIKKRILSPTFTIIREHDVNIKYQISNIKFQINKLRLYHVDLYRVQNLNDIKGLGIEEIINDPKNIIVVEWAEKMGDLLPKERIDIWLEYLDEDKRKIIMRMYSNKNSANVSESR